MFQNVNIEVSSLTSCGNNTLDKYQYSKDNEYISIQVLTDLYKPCK